MYQFYKACERPTNKQFKEVATATAYGFVVMGLVGFFVKVVHIPINHILNS